MREQLRAACQMLEAIGMDAFAGRARRELRAALTAPRRGQPNMVDGPSYKYELVQRPTNQVTRACRTRSWSTGGRWVPGYAVILGPAVPQWRRAWPVPRRARAWAIGPG